MEDQALEQLTFKEINHEAALAAACEKVAIGEFFSEFVSGCRQYRLEGMVHTTG